MGLGQALRLAAAAARSGRTRVFLAGSGHGDDERFLRGVGESHPWRQRTEHCPKRSRPATGAVVRVALDHAAVAVEQAAPWGWLRPASSRPALPVDLPAVADIISAVPGARGAHRRRGPGTAMIGLAAPGASFSVAPPGARTLSRALFAERSCSSARDALHRACSRAIARCGRVVGGLPPGSDVVIPERRVLSAAAGVGEPRSEDVLRLSGWRSPGSRPRGPTAQQPSHACGGGRSWDPASRGFVAPRPPIKDARSSHRNASPGQRPVW